MQYWNKFNFTILLVAMAIAPCSLGQPETDVASAWVEIALPNFPEGAAYVLGRLTNEELIRVARSEPVYLALVNRDGIDVLLRSEAILALAEIRETDAVTEILDGIGRLDVLAVGGDGVLQELVGFLVAEPRTELTEHRATLVALATGAKRSLSREGGYAALIVADADGAASWRLAEGLETGYIDLLNGVPLIPELAVQGVLYSRIEGLLVAAPTAAVRRVALLTLASMPGHEAETFVLLTSLVRVEDDRDAAIAGLLQVPSGFWAATAMPELAGSLVEYATGVAPEKRNSDAFKRAVQLGNAVAMQLPPEQSRDVRALLHGLGILTVTIRAVPHLLLYDKAHIVVEAGEPIEITFENSGMMPHNMLVVAPGALEEIGLAADRMIANLAGVNEKTFVPDSAKVLHATPLLDPGTAATLTFVAPDAVGDYPYMCTYLGHWIRMNGILHVVEDVDVWIAMNPEKLLESAPELHFVREWTVEDLVNDLGQLDVGRSMTRGEELFTTASCSACHRIGDVGGLIGPDLTDVASRLDATAMLTEIISPSTIINEAYQMWRIELNVFDVLCGLISSEDSESIRVMASPLDESGGVEVARDEIETMVAADVSTMPMGLLNFFTREDILDLLAYLRFNGEPAG